MNTRKPFAFAALLTLALGLSFADAQSTTVRTWSSSTYTDAEGIVTMPFKFETPEPDDVMKLYHDPVMVGYFEYLHDLAKAEGYGRNCYSRKLFFLSNMDEATFRKRQQQWVQALKTGSTAYTSARTFKDDPFTNSSGRITVQLALLEKPSADSAVVFGFFHSASRRVGYIIGCGL